LGWNGWGNCCPGPNIRIGGSGKRAQFRSLLERGERPGGGKGGGGIKKRRGEGGSQKGGGHERSGLYSGGFSCFLSGDKSKVLARKKGCTKREKKKESRNLPPRTGAGKGLRGKGEGTANWTMQRGGCEL